jgi:Uma2 family endonuclease
VDRRPPHGYSEKVRDLEALPRDRIRPLERAWYDRLVGLGAFPEDEKLELLEGRIVVMSPQGTAHAYVIQCLMERFVALLAGRAQVRVQLPFAASAVSEPEPDVALVPPGPYLDDHPREAMLVVEVAESSVEVDRLKARLYAEAAVPEYWIVNLGERVVEVHRRPAEGGYGDVARAAAGEALSPHAFPDLTIRVDELLPPVQ